MLKNLSEMGPGVWRCLCHDGTVFFAVLDGEEDRSSLPANGGLRFWPYTTEEEAVADGKVLGRHMSWKHRLYRTGFSGVKIVAKGDPRDQDTKKEMLKTVADFLNRFKGAIYTGCDLNINNGDMEFLASMTPYVLSALGSKIDSSRATGHGVYGCVRAHAAQDSLHLTCLVHGVGKVGSTVAELLVKDGHRVLAFDSDPSRAEGAGMENVSHHPAWWRAECDVVVLCSRSYLITEEIAKKLQCRILVSGANSPFASDKVGEILNQRGIVWVPDVITNAGAVICDSVEHYAPELFRATDPEVMYQYVQQMVANKTLEFLKHLHQTGLPPEEVLQMLLERQNPKVCGTEFRAWLEQRKAR